MKILKQLMIFLIFVLTSISAAQAATAMTVYKSPTCGCCEKYVNYLRENGFTVKTENESNMDAIKKNYGMSHAASCHTALVNGYVVEGHVQTPAKGLWSVRTVWIVELDRDVPRFVTARPPKV